VPPAIAAMRPARPAKRHVLPAFRLCLARVRVDRNATLRFRPDPRGVR